MPYPGWIDTEGRRRAVRKLIKEGQWNSASRRRIREEFGVTDGTITSDLVALKAGLYGPISCNVIVKDRIKERDRHTCQYCGKPGNQVDHVLPRMKSGPGKPFNLVCACAKCNCQRTFKFMLPKNFEEITKDRPAWREVLAEYGRSFG